MSFFDDDCDNEAPCISRAGYFVNTCGVTDGCVPIVTPPECLPYACDSFESAIADLGLPAGTWMKAWSEVPAATTPLAWPFSTVSTGVATDPANFWADYVAAPAVVPTWTGVDGNTYIGRESSNVGVLTSPDFCGGAVQQVAYVDATKPGAPIALVKQSEPPGNPSMALLASKRTSSTNINKMEGTIIFGHGKRWTFNLGAVPLSGGLIGSINIALTTAIGGDTTVTCTVENNDVWGFPDYVTSKVIGNISDSISLITATISTSPPYAINEVGVSNSWVAVVDATLKIIVNGVEHVLIAPYLISASNVISSEPITVNNIVETDTNLYQCGRFLTGATLSFAGIACSTTDVIDFNNTDLHTHFLRNFSGYTPPAYCDNLMAGSNWLQADSVATNTGFFQTGVCAPVDPCFDRGSFFVDYCLDDTDGDGCIPYVPPDGPPPLECLPYACNRLEETLLTLTPDAVVAIGVTGPDLPTGTPLADSQPGGWGHPDLFTAWNWFISGPVPNFNFTTSSAYPGYSDLSGVSWAADLEKLQLCDLNGVTQQPKYVAHFLANSSVCALSVPTRFLYNAADPDNPLPQRQGSTTTALVTGYGGASLGSLNLVNNHAGRVVAYYTDGSDSGAIGHQLYANFTSQGLQFGVMAVDTVGQVADSDYLDFGETLAGQWLYVSLTEGVEFTEQPLTDEFTIIRTVKATVTRMDTGATLTSTIQGTATIATGGKTIQSLVSIHDGTMYEAPYFFRGNTASNRISWAFLSHGPETFDHDSLHTAFKQSFVDYVPPEYC